MAMVCFSAIFEREPPWIFEKNLAAGVALPYATPLSGKPVSGDGS